MAKTNTNTLTSAPATARRFSLSPRRPARTQSLYIDEEVLTKGSEVARKAGLRSFSSWANRELRRILDLEP